jgi:hypothetical protein
MTDQQFSNQVLEKYRQQTIREHSIHSKHITAWLYGKNPWTPCPCMECYLGSRFR